MHEAIYKQTQARSLSQQNPTLKELQENGHLSTMTFIDVVDFPRYFPSDDSRKIEIANSIRALILNVDFESGKTVFTPSSEILDALDNVEFGKWKENLTADEIKFIKSFLTVLSENDVWIAA